MVVPDRTPRPDAGRTTRAVPTAPREVTPMPDSPRPEPPSPADPNSTAVGFRTASPGPSNVWWGTGTTRTFDLIESDADAGGREVFREDITNDLSARTDAEARPDSAADLLPAMDPTGRYLVGGVIGRGGMGVVHEGWDVQLERVTAVKVLLKEHKGKPEVVRRFLEEARITSRLQHPGIVAIHELGVSPDDRPFFVMRLVRGQTLEQILRRRADASIDLPHLLAIFLQICQAVAYAHSQGVIHRDLKPANVMVGAFGVVKVMDWGLAKVLSEAAPPAADPADPADPANWCGGGGGGGGGRALSVDPTRPETLMGTVFGTPAYLAPEQARGEIDRVDRRVDVFGLGSILCEILTGVPPYRGIDGREIYEKAFKANTADAFARLNACPVPVDLISLAKWCLSADLLARPADAGIVVEVMTAHLQSNLRRAELDLVRFFDLSLDLFCIASTDGYFLRVNENFSRILGYTADELTARPFLDFVHPDDRNKTEVVVVELSNGEPIVQFVNRYRHADGHYVWLEWSAQTIPEERAIYAAARDVTDRVRQAEAHRRGEQSRLHLAAIVNSADIAIYSTSLDSTVQSWNPGAERLFGYRADEIIGRSLLLLFVPGCEGEESEILSRLKHCERIEHYETVRRHKDGTVVPISVTVSVVKDEAGTAVGTSRISRDIGDRKKSEAAAVERLKSAAFVSATGAALIRGGGLRASLQAFAELAVGHLGVAFARVWTLNEAAGVLELQASAGLYTHLDGPHSRVAVGEYKIGRIARDRKPHLTNAVIGDPQVSDRAWAVREGMVAFAGHPLVVEDRVVGVMAVFARHPLSDDLLETLRAVSDSLALGVRRHQLEGELRDLRAALARPAADPCG